MRFFALALTSTTLLAACGGSSPNSIASCSAKPTDPQISPKLKYLTLAASNHSELSAYSSNTLIPEGTELMVIVKEPCLSLGPITENLSDFQNLATPSGTRAYKWRLPSSLSHQTLSSRVDTDQCVVRVEDSLYDQPDQDFTSEWVSELEPFNTTAGDPSIPLQKHLDAIEAGPAYEIFFAPDTGIQTEVVIAVIDSGISLSHEDLKANLWVNQDEVPGNRKDDDGNGYIDDVHGYNFASNKPSPAYEKTSLNSAWQYAHGTKVAGLAAAVSGNGKGGTGVMGKAKIMALNNMGRDTSMAQADTANAIRYAVDNGAHVINLSLGGNTSAGQEYKEALQYALEKHVVVLAAAGNEDSRISQSYSAAGQASSLGGLISIGNYRAADFAKSATSNYSPTYVELGAPGTYTSDKGLYTPTPTTDKSYAYFSGTSAAVPVASGAAALAIGLIRSRQHTYTAAEIEFLLLESAQKVSALTSYFRDGNALNLASLARLIDQLYPAGSSKQVPQSRWPTEPAPPPTETDSPSSTNEVQPCPI